ncbi:hypothetical protein, partial [Methylophilus sp.]|uniref:hypothetical protein n=1 Tax=Methylophilus sp. TaxID=29541 RepID=UPI00403646F4
RKQAEARVPFLLVTFSLGKQRKVTRRGAKNNGESEHRTIQKTTKLQLPATAPKLRPHLT